MELVSPEEVLPSRPTWTREERMDAQRSYRKSRGFPRRAGSPATEVVIMTDRRREAYAPSNILRTGPSRSSPPLPEVDPVAEALQLIKADMTAQVRSGADDAAKTTKPVIIKLNGATTHYRSTVVPAVDRPRSPLPPLPLPPRDPVDNSIFQDGIENFRLHLGRGCRGRAITERFGELLHRQAAVQQLQRRLRRQTVEMTMESRRITEEADRIRRERFRDCQEPPPPPQPPVPPTTAVDTLMVLRDQGGCCGTADLCLTPPDLPGALALIHRLRCEVLELRACSLRATYEKNEMAMVLNQERAQLRRTFTDAQIDRLTGKIRSHWAAEDVRRAIAARRVLTRRQYRYVTDVMCVPLPDLKLRTKAIRTGDETKRLYEQLVEEKVLMHMTKKRRVKRPARPTPKVSAHPDALISLAPASSDSEDGDQLDYQAEHSVVSRKRFRRQ